MSKTVSFGKLSHGMKSEEAKEEGSQDYSKLTLDHFAEWIYPRSADKLCLSLSGQRPGLDHSNFTEVVHNNLGHLLGAGLHYPPMLLLAYLNFFYVDAFPEMSGISCFMVYIQEELKQC